MTSSPCYRADVVMQAHGLDAGNFQDHRFHGRPRRFHEMRANLLEQVSALLGWERLDQLLFGGRQDALETDHDEIAQQMRVYVLGTPAHEVLFKATDPLANGGFDLPL
jgi:hypothetical protein